MTSAVAISTSAAISKRHLNAGASAHSGQARHKGPHCNANEGLAVLATNRQRRAMLRNSLVFAALATLAVLLGVPAKAYEPQNFFANDEGQIEFVMPSGNIGCIYTPAGGTSVYETVDGLAEIQCDRVEPSYVRAILGGQGGGYLIEDVGDASCCSLMQRFEYDHVVTLGPFQCLSERRGLTCARQDGHGFFLSRALVQAR